MVRYRRMGGIIAVCAFLLMFLVVPAMCFGDEVGFGPLYLRGHSYDGGYSVESGIGGRVSYEMPWKKKHVNIGLSYDYVQFETQNNADCSYRSIDAHLLAVYLKPYWQVTKRVRWAFMAGGGADISRDTQGPMMVTGTSLEYWISPRWAVAPTLNVYITGQRNYKVGAFMIKYHF